MAAVPITLPPSGSVSRGTSQRRDDEGGEDEAELWAALERLPTFDRARTAILEQARSARQERKPVRVKDVDLQQYVANQLFRLNNPEVDHQIFLTKLRKRIDE